VDLRVLADFASSAGFVLSLVGLLAAGFSVWQFVSAERHLRRKATEMVHWAGSELDRVRTSLLKDPPDDRALHEAERVLQQVTLQLEERERKEVREALQQPSERGRADYIAKILGDVARGRARVPRPKRISP